MKLSRSGLLAALLVSLFCISGVAVIAAPAASRGTPAVQTPKVENSAALAAEIPRLVGQQMAHRRGYLPGDMIASDDAEPVLKEIERRTQRTAELNAIRRELVPGNSNLAQQLRTPAGQTFMRQAAKFGHSYDRIDHLSRLPDGPQLLSRLIQGPDGYKLIEFLTTTDIGRETGRQLSEAPGGAKFNAPTGRIYTAEELVIRLQKLVTTPVQPSRVR